MNYKLQLQAFLIVALFTAAALVPVGCASNASGPAPLEPLPLELYD